MVAAGIHFGNTNSVITIWKDGKVDTVSNETGDRITSTAVAYTGTEKIVGQPAKQYMVKNPLSCISNIKSCVGQSFTSEQMQKIKTKCSCHVSNTKNVFAYQVKVDDNYIKVSPVEAASYIFTKLLEIGELVGGSELEDVVLTVPHNFSEDQRISLCEAAENIGCNILRVISEPAAACLAYGIGQNDPLEHSTVLIYRLGGSSMDACIMEVINGMYHMVHYKSNSDFGSNEFDNVLIKYFTEEFKRIHKEDISENKRALGKLSAAAEDCKHGLSKLHTIACAVDSLHDGIDFHCQLPRAKFESLCGFVFSKCMELVDELLLEANFKVADIDKVILVGGGSRMPRLVQLMKNKFDSSEILNTIHTEEVLAQGAALQAGLLQGRDDTLNTDVFNLNCISKNIGIKLANDDKLYILLNKNTPVPVKRSANLIVPASQTTACVYLYECEDATLTGSLLLAKLVIRDLNDEAKELFLNIEFRRNGCLSVILTDRNSNKTESVNIEMTRV
ncbi:heat shock 70 kDa protein 14 isoform X2 [Hydra vulgaris]|uniref:Heat shock 70 kDa protein 14 isoform X2 n=1 Tax=Hydra vulgaris TaxID=6087 RepID=A0ABM4D8M4_HYDVU